jgi:hypothetical protein
MAALDDFDPRFVSAGRRRPLGLVAARPTFYFDLASPYAYLAAERAERMGSRLRWVPASSEALRCRAAMTREGRAEVARRAGEIGLALSWPPAPAPRVAGAMRVASLAVQQGVGALFVLAASRLAFCGAHDIEDLRILGDAAYVAGISHHDMLEAAFDCGRDNAIELAGSRLLLAGAERLPALHAAGRLCCDESLFDEVLAAARDEREPDDAAAHRHAGGPQRPQAGVDPLARLRDLRAPS